MIRITKYIYALALASFTLAVLCFCSIKNIYADNGPCTGGSKANTTICTDAGRTGGADGSDATVIKLINSIINMLLYGAGILSVVMVVTSSIRYISAHGDKAQATSARNTLVYSVVGLVVTICAYAIVNFVLDRLS